MPTVGVVKASSPAPVALGGMFGVGVVVGGVSWLNGRHAPPRAAADVATANIIHVVLGLLVASALVLGARRDRDRVRRFLAWPFTIEGWRSLMFATVAIPLSLWELATVATRRSRRRREAVGVPVALALLVAVATIWYMPFRGGVQLSAGLDRSFTIDAWGGPSYLGAALAHWLDGCLLFYAAMAVVRLLTRTRIATPSPGRERAEMGSAT